MTFIQTILAWISVNILLVIAVILAAIVLVLLIAGGRESSAPGASARYAAIRASSSATIMTFIIGILVSAAIAAIIWLGFVWLVRPYFPPAIYPPWVWYPLHLLGIVAGILVATPLFFAGRFDILAGQKAFLYFFGIPFGRLGPGWAWIFPGLMSFELKETAAIQDKSAKPEEYLTAEGIEMFVESEATVAIEDPLLTKAIQGGDIAAYVSARRRSAVRRYISTVSMRSVIDLATKEDPTATELAELFKEIKSAKGEISANGPNTVIGYMNEEIAAFGLRAQQVQFETVLFNDALESKSQRIFEEVAEALGLRKDATNKAMVIKALDDKLLSDMGIKTDDLTKEEKLDMLRRGIAFALAAEGQGNYNFNDFGQPPPSGVMVGVTPTTSGASDARTTST
jgi:hypothetical protein